MNTLERSVDEESILYLSSAQARDEFLMLCPSTKMRVVIPEDGIEAQGTSKAELRISDDLAFYAAGLTRGELYELFIGALYDNFASAKKKAAEAFAESGASMRAVPVPDHGALPEKFQKRVDEIYYEVAAAGLSEEFGDYIRWKQDGKTFSCPRCG